MSQVVIGDVLPRTQAVAVGAQTVYGTNWTANYPSDVVVYSRASGVPANDLTQQLNYPADYSVAFIGGSQTVQVTLVNPSTAGDIVTIIRNTPADRENLYTNTNFVPTMLNNDFGILTLVDQQAQLVDQLVGPRYNYSAIINPLLLDEDTILPILPANHIWAKNSTNTAIEAINLSSVISGGTVTEVDTGLGLTGGPIDITGTISFAPMDANSFWGNVLGVTAVPTMVPTSYFLQASAIGVTVQPFSAALTSIAGLTTGANNLIYTTASNTYGVIAPVANAVLITSGGSVPSFSQTLPSAVQTNITKLGMQTQALDMGGNFIHNLHDPVADQDAATKHYVDVTASGLSVQPAAQAATTTNLNATPAGAGVGATLTNAGAMAAFAVDGYSASLNDAILVKDQTLTQHNGIYIVTTLGSGAANWVLTRATYYDTNVQIVPGNLVAVNMGTVNGGSAWLQTATVATVDTNPILFSPFAVITAGTGLTKTGTVISLTNPVAMNLGGTNANLSASNGAIPYSTATAIALLGAGTSGQLFQSGGAGAPNWTTALYPSLAGTAGHVLTSDGTNFISAASASGADFPVNTNITSMTGLTGYLKFPLGVKDASGNVIVNFKSIASAVNYLEIYNSNTGASPTLSAIGTDPAVNLLLQSKGGGFQLLDNTLTNGAQLSFLNGLGTFATSLAVASNQSTNLNLQLPALDGVANAPLITNGSGVLSFGGTFTDISASVTPTGFSSITSKIFRQCKIGNIVHLSFIVGGISNSTSFTITGLPSAAQHDNYLPCLVTNNGANAFGMVVIPASSTTMTIYLTASSNVWTASGAKAVYGSVFYEST